MRILKNLPQRLAVVLPLFAIVTGFAAAPAAAQQSQDWAMRACKNEVGARIADLLLSEITVETATADGEGNAVINWRTTRLSSGFCRVSRQGNIIQFKVEEMARPATTGTQTDSVEAAHITACRNEAARRIGVNESEVFVRPSQREGDQSELDWRVRRRAAGYCRVDARGRITAFETYRQGEGGTGTGSSGTGTGTVGGTGTGTSGDSIPYAQRAAYDSGYSWGDDDRRSNRSRSVQRYSDLYTNDTQPMFSKGYDDGFDRRTKNYTLPGSGGGTGTGGSSGTGTGTTTADVVKPGRYAIEFARTGKVLDLRTEDGTTVQQWSGSFLMNKKNQLWDIEDARNGYFYIRSVENGKALTARGTANGSAVEATVLGNRREQQWRIKVLDTGEAIIVSRLGPALDLPGGDNDNGVKPHLWQEHGRDNQRFRLKPAS